MVLNKIKNMEFCCPDIWGYSVMGSNFNKVFFFNFLRGSRLRVSSISLITSCSTNAMAAYSQVFVFNLVQLKNLVFGLTVTQFRISIQFSGKKYPGRAPNNLLRLVICNRLVNLGISKQQHLYLKTEFNLKTQT